VTARDPRPSRLERVDRTRARSWTTQVLYRWESQGRSGGLLEAFQDVLRTRRIAERRIPIVRDHLERVDDHLAEIDGVLSGALDNWRLERLSRIDRSILRLATSEILFDEEVPPKVALQEGIRLAGQYGGPESPRFVNGVLDAVLRIREEGGYEGAPPPASQAAHGTEG